MPVNFNMLQPIQAPQVVAALPGSPGGGGIGGALKGIAGIMGAFSPKKPATAPAGMQADPMLASVGAYDPTGSNPQAQASNNQWLGRSPADMASKNANPNGLFKDPNIVLNTIKGFEGFSSKTYWDVNAHRLGYGTDTITKADGTIIPVRQGMTVSKEDAARDLFRRSHDFAVGARNAVGADVWSQYSPGAQAALTSIAYNYGSLPKRILPAARSGDPNQLAKAIQGLGNDNKGVNKHRRNKEAMMVMGSMQTSMNNQPAQPMAPPPAQPSPQTDAVHNEMLRQIDAGRDSYAAAPSQGGINWNLLQPNNQQA